MSEHPDDARAHAQPDRGLATDFKGLVVRRERVSDAAERASVLDVVDRAFDADAPGEGARVRALTEALLGSDAHVGLSLVAEQDGRVVGHTLLTRGWVDAPRRLVEVLVLSPLSVEPGFQGRGTGSALVRAALVAAEAAGAPAVFLEGSPGYYGRLGFGPGAAHGFGRPSVRIPEPAFQVALLATHEPWMTGALVYADPFWAHDCVGLRD
ncbi:GNAT family N-acetyltransferase [Phycicoccus flavus]|uniref:N-acetyltransferase n=1 Tax=Phycicoccus flavus TaxID=2502783 RepID=A0A8T6QZ63_9MICO|nr:GNAT family N-acetyltransferase [Phycicoccus flavus]NHA66947.1 N-acetyltransferase [Phycicoccus flavus]